MVTGKYLHGKEKENHFFKLGRMNKGDYLFTRILKLYNTEDLLIYSYDDNLEVRIIGMFMLMEGKLSELGGLMIPLLDKRSYKLTSATCVPKKLRGFDIAVQIPDETTVCRSVKVMSSGRNMNGVTTDVRFLQRSNPHSKVPGDHYLVPLLKAEAEIGAAELNRAFERLEG
jgi:hypothetical protein